MLNHFGPEGNYLPLLAPAFFHKERMTPWGNGIAYDVDAVRRYIIEAPLYWLTEYHLDGLRFDAIDQIEDSSAGHVLVEIAQRIREDITDRPIHLTTEDSRNIISLHPRDQDGNAPLFTAEWNDDFHNAVHVLRPERPGPTTTILLMPRKNTSQERWPKDSLIRGNLTANRRTSRRKSTGQPRSPLWILFRTTIRSVTAPGATD